MNNWSSRVLEIFERVIAVARDRRDALLDAECGEDRTLRQEVESLVDAHEQAGAFLEPPERPDASPGANPPGLAILRDQYTVTALLAVGGMGTVHAVRHKLLGQERVVKTIRPELARAPALRERFLREAQLATRVDHPNVARVYDFGIEAGTPYLVMERVGGHTVGALLEHYDSLPVRLAVEVVVQTLRALERIHTENIVHRDIASDNVMVSAGGDGRPIVKLIDFGIARSLDMRQRLTVSGLFLGKVMYAAPELFGVGGLEAAEPRSDLYSVGVLAYQMMTGRSPISGADFRSIISGHLNRPPAPFEETDPTGRIPGEVRAVVLRALEKRVEDRFPDARSFREALAAASPGELARGWSVILEDLPAAPAPCEEVAITHVPAPSLARETAVPRVRTRRAWWAAAMGLIAVAGLILVVRSSASGSETWNVPPHARVARAVVPPLAALEPALGTLALDVHPWARIERLSGPRGAIPSSWTVTPCRLSLPPGRYHVVLGNPSFDKPIEVDAELQPGTELRVVRSFDGFDVEELVRAAGGS